MFKRAVTAAGWVAGLVTLLVGGSVLAAGSFSRHERHRVWAVAVLALGVLAALLEGSYRVWDSTESSYTSRRRGRRTRYAGERRRAYLHQCIREARSLIEDIAAQGADWHGEQARIYEDTSHWEAGVRADIRKAWGTSASAAFRPAHRNGSA